MFKLTEKLKPGLGSRLTEFPTPTPDSDSLAFPTPTPDSDSPKNLPTPDSRLLHCDKFSKFPTPDSRLRLPNFSDSRLPTPYPQKSTDSGLPTPDSDSQALRKTTKISADQWNLRNCPSHCAVSKTVLSIFILNLNSKAKTMK